MTDHFPVCVVAGRKFDAARCCAIVLKRSTLHGSRSTKAMNAWKNNELLAVPAYSPAEAARILSVNYTTLMYWIAGRRYNSALIKLASDIPPELSFTNLIECHALKALTVRYYLKMRRIRSGLETLKKMFKSEHPLLDKRFRTDGIDLFLQESRESAPVNLSKGGQLALREIVDMYLERVVWNADGLVKYYPFVYKEQPNEPKIISMTPMIAFGKSVIDGTGISTAVIASRFAAREDPKALAQEYGRSEQEIWEAIRWEGEYRKAAA
ncbi:MAG TPA: DUF433 domain-containing protein [Candidatus Binataceae bacterium]